MSRSVLRQLPRPVWILLGAVLINRIGLVVVPMLSLYLRELGFDERSALWSGSVYAIGATLGVLPAGMLADKIGRKRTLVLVMAATAAGMLALSLAQGPALLLCGVFGVGLVAEAYRPVVSAMLTDLVPPDRRIPAFALHRTVVNLGHAIGPMLAGLLAAAALYRWLFYVDGATAACFALLALLFLPETKPGRPTGDTRSPWPFHDRRFLVFCVGLLPVSCAYFQILAALPIHLRDSLPEGPAGFEAPALFRWILDRAPVLPGRELLATPEATYGLLMAINALLIVGLEYRLSLGLRRFAPFRVLSGGAILTGLGLILIGLVTSSDGALLGVVVATFGEMLFAPTALYLVSRFAPDQARARYLALFGITHGVALVLAPSIAGLMLPWSGPRPFWCLSGGACWLAVLVFRRLPQEPPARSLTAAPLVP